MSEIKPKGIGEGKHKFRIHLSARVRIDSEIIRADSAIEAYRLFRGEIDLDTLLRNLAGSGCVAQVQNGEQLLLAKIDLAGDDGRCVTEIIQLGPEALETLENDL